MVARQNRPEPAPVRSTFGRFPTQIQQWSGQQLPPLDSRILRVLGVDDYLNRAYSTPDRAMVGLYVGFYNSQRKATRSFADELPAGPGWEPLSRASVKIPGDDAGDHDRDRRQPVRYSESLDRQFGAVLVPKPRSDGGQWYWASCS